MFPSDTRIMIVDDMKMMRILVRKGLKELGFTNVEEFEDGARAWTGLEASLKDPVHFQLIISDWTMPNMSGLELLQKVRAHEKLKAVPFILLTAEADPALIKQAEAAGVTNYVTKPFTPEILKYRLQKSYAMVPKTAA